MNDKRFNISNLLTKERLIWAFLLLLLGGWQGLTHYINLGEDAQASMTQGFNSVPGAAPIALEERVRALEIFKASQEVTVQDIKEEITKMDAKVDQVLGILASTNGRKPK